MLINTTTTVKFIDGVCKQFRYTPNRYISTNNKLRLKYTGFDTYCEPIKEPTHLDYCDSELLSLYIQQEISKSIHEVLIGSKNIAWSDVPNKLLNCCVEKVYAEVMSE